MIALALALVALLFPQQTTVPDGRCQTCAVHVDVDGTVRTPGRYALQTGDTIGAILQRAGGVTVTGPLVYIVSRGEGRQQVHCRASADWVVANHDLLLVVPPEAKVPMPQTLCADVLVTQ
jgi:hypothetical protein